MDNHKYSPYTQVAHNGRNKSISSGFVNPPIYHGSTVLFDSYEDFKNSRNRRGQRNQVIYGRYGTPLTFSLETALAELEGADAAIATPSGLSAIVTALNSFVKQGDHILVVDSVYQPTRKYCDQVLARFGIQTEYYDPTIGNDIEELIKPNTAVIFLESPGSQTFEMQDIPAITAVARQHGVISILDNTWATPIFLKPFELGVDISVHAATKYITGHSDAMLGIIAVNEECYENVRNNFRLSGQCAGPDTVYFGLRGLRTMPIRLQRHYESGIIVAKWLEKHPQVARVIHPALPSHPGYDLWKRDFSGASGLFSLILHEISDQQLGLFLDNARLFGMGYSWGGYESLLIPFDPNDYRTINRWQPEGPSLRMHVGLEDPQDLIADLEFAFKSIHNPS